MYHLLPAGRRGHVSHTYLRSPGLVPRDPYEAALALLQGVLDLKGKDTALVLGRAHLARETLLLSRHDCLGPRESPV